MGTWRGTHRNKATTSREAACDKTSSLFTIQLNRAEIVHLVPWSSVSVQRGVQIALTFFSGGAPSGNRTCIVYDMNIWAQGRREHIHVELLYGRTCSSRPTSGEVNFLQASFCAKKPVQSAIEPNNGRGRGSLTATPSRGTIPCTSLAGDL